jgi:hypothetical protein
VELRYQLEPSDADALSLFANRHGFAVWVVRAFPFARWALGALAALWVFDARIPVFSGIAGVLAGAGMAVMMGSVLKWTTRRRHANARMRAPSLFGNARTLVVSDQGLDGRSEGASGRTEWSRVKGFGETGSHLFIMLDDVVGYPVPKRDLTATQIEELRSELERHCQRIV